MGHYCKHIRGVKRQDFSFVFVLEVMSIESSYSLFTTPNLQNWIYISFKTLTCAVFVWNTYSEFILAVPLKWIYILSSHSFVKENGSVPSVSNYFMHGLKDKCALGLSNSTQRLDDGWLTGQTTEIGLKARCFYEFGFYFFSF